MQAFYCCTVCIVVIDAEKIGLSGSTNTLRRRYGMSTLDEITKEKQRISEALARVDTQREKLASQLGELEATERVLARYSKGTQVKKTASARPPTTAKKAAAPARRHGRHDDRKSRWRQAQFVEPRRPGPRAGNRQDAAGNRRCMQGRSPQPCRRRALPGTSGRASSKSAMGNSTPYSRWERSNAPRSDTMI